jgi:DnaJ-class molecular chaperone
MSIKLRGEWHSGRDGNGDLYITFEVPEREGWLERDGADLHYVVKLSPALATLWGKCDIEIPILGKRTLDIKHGTPWNETLKFRDEWLPRLDRRGLKWDLIIHYEIDIPTKLSSEEKKLYSALLEIQSGKKMEKGFLESIFE